MKLKMSFSLPAFMLLCILCSAFVYLFMYVSFLRGLNFQIAIEEIVSSFPAFSKFFFPIHGILAMVIGVELLRSPFRPGETGEGGLQGRVCVCGEEGEGPSHQMASGGGRGERKMAAALSPRQMHAPSPPRLPNQGRVLS